MGMGFAPTWLRQVSPPASQNHFNHWSSVYPAVHVSQTIQKFPLTSVSDTVVTVSN